MLFTQHRVFMGEAAEQVRRRLVGVVKTAANILPPQPQLHALRLMARVRDRRRFNNFQRLRCRENSAGYSLASLEQTGSIFVHIPKCAGISIATALYGNLGGGHLTLRQYATAFPPGAFLNYFKFAVVRNPWDRLVSAYHFLKGGGLTEKDSSFFQRELAVFSDFSEFVNGWVSRDNIWKWHHFRPQTHYLNPVLGQFGIDFVALMENLPSDFAIISKRVGGGANLPVKNKSKRRPYAEYYEGRTRRIVADVYRDDIATLGYHFGNSTLEAQLERRDQLGGVLWRVFS